MEQVHVHDFIDHLIIACKIGGHEERAPSLMSMLPARIITGVKHFIKLDNVGPYWVR